MPLTASAGVPPIVLVGESRIGAVAYDLGDSGHRGDRVVVGDDAGSVTVWEGELRKWSYTGHTDRIRMLAWVGNWIFSASDDRTVRAWYAGQGESAHPCPLWSSVTESARA